MWEMDKIEMLVEKLGKTRDAKHLSELNKMGVIVSFMHSGIKWSIK
jgi:hypothetical protein